MATALHLSLSAETLFAVGEFQVTNSILTSLIVSVLLILFAVVVRSKLTRTSQPSGIQNVAEFLVENLYSFVQTTTHDHKKTRNFFPLIATFFLFIILNNWLGLLPGVGSIGFTKIESEPIAQLSLPSVSTVSASTPLESEATTVETTAVEKMDGLPRTDAEAVHEEKPQTAFVPFFRPGTADLNTTAALAIISIIMVQVFGFAYLGTGYLTKYFNFESPIMFFVGLLELVSEFSKILSFAFRLFGNIFAGEVLLAVMGVLAPIIVPMPFYGLELFVGFIQALVFSLLSLVFFNMATESHKTH
jgi:F-type H+-transporting ATPase subunit a